jgi:AcrR family transcriptional regulator
MDDNSSWRAKRRQTIVVAAARLFAQLPFERVQMDAIAQEAGVGKPTLYRYFPSKQDLYLAVCEAAFNALERRMAEAAKASLPAEAIERMVEALITVLDRQIATVTLLDKEAGPLSSRWRALYRRHRQAILGSLRGVIEAGIARSDFHNLDIEIAPGLIIGAIRGALLANNGVPRAQLIEQMTRFILDGLGAGTARQHGVAAKHAMQAGSFGAS